MSRLIKIVEDDLFDHIPILHSGFNGSARTFSGTLNYGCVTARSILLKSMVRMQEGEQIFNGKINTGRNDKKVFEINVLLARCVCMNDDFWRADNNIC